MERKILDLLKDGPRTSVEIAKAMGAEKREISKNMHDLCKREAVERVKESPPTWKLPGSEHSEGQSAHSHDTAAPRMRHSSGRSTGSNSSASSSHSSAQNQPPVTPTSSDTSLGLDELGLNEEKEILSVLQHINIPVPTLQIAKAIGKTTAKDVNKYLYNLEKRNYVMKVQDQPPTWRATSKFQKAFKSHFKEFYSVVDDLGQGGFGKVVKAQHKLDKQLYAVKMIAISEEEKERVLREVVIMADLQHKNIVQYKPSWIDVDYADWEEDDSSYESSTRSGEEEFGELSDAKVKRFQSFSSTTSSSGKEQPAIRQLVHISKNKEGTWQQPEHNSSGQFYLEGQFDRSVKIRRTSSSSGQQVSQGLCQILCIPMELCDTNLKAKLVVERKVDREWNKHVLTNISEGLAYIHSKDIVHCDLTPANIFLSYSQSGSLFPQAKIGDFGLSNVYKKSPDGCFNISNKGTSFYKAPELSQGVPCDHRADVYSFGVIFVELFCSFGSEMERGKELGLIKEAKCDGLLDSIFSDSKAKILVEKMVDLKFSNRPQITKLCQNICELSYF